MAAPMQTPQTIRDGPAPEELLSNINAGSFAPVSVNVTYAFRPEPCRGPGLWLTRAIDARAPPPGRTTRDDADGISLPTCFSVAYIRVAGGRGGVINFLYCRTAQRILEVTLEGLAAYHTAVGAPAAARRDNAAD
ncbi:hypothetical protein EVAR_56176_1 [Eumeta japonica]|uniref:Uncharacterized protein n=1 Tax=Eumeta variegata TaxID=151549 RepID=A0A4C1ZTF7_EUMVA|nr:hypothetical protein EVAR_56176_1 [Eumeta japonica]